MNGELCMSRVAFGLVCLAASLLQVSVAKADDAQLERGRQGIESRAGCYVVDYSFVETEGIKPGYVKDNRVYDVDQDKTVKEWIFSEDMAPGHIRLQHVLFETDLDGKMIDGAILKHTGEDWVYNASYLYDFVAPGNWNVVSLGSTPGTWTRGITNLDDGLRYQCSSTWSLSTEYPEWTCDDFAPIPGRETRDMGRKDYNTLLRSTRVIAYGPNWLERENNVKTILANGVRTPLAKEVGKSWYTRVPDSQCAVAQDFTKPRLAVWLLMRDVWNEVLLGDRPFSEKTVDGESRYDDMMDIQDEYMQKDLANPAVRKAAHDEILGVINAYRN